VTAAENGTQPRWFRFANVFPLVLFVVLAAIFLVRLLSGVDPGTIPSALVGKPAPEFDLPPLDGMGVPGLSRADLAGGVTVVNIFGSWCAPCRQEHPMLVTLSEDDRIRLVGIDYKDQPENARRFLGEFGNPFAAIGVDLAGRTFIDWGAYGVPETYVIDAGGIVRYRFIGPLSAAALVAVLAPEIEKAMTPLPTPDPVAIPANIVSPGY
jgi:cytochrome c biogenesis protein CcmG/thiol:disulfide interchange protein DsbE